MPRTLRRWESFACWGLQGRGLGVCAKYRPKSSTSPARLDIQKALQQATIRVIMLELCNMICREEVMEWTYWICIIMPSPSFFWASSTHMDCRLTLLDGTNLEF